jgi:hypothetical protein
MRARLFAVAILLQCLQLHGQPGPTRFSSNGEVLPSIGDADGARKAEARLQAHPEDIEPVGQLLDFYLQHWREADAKPTRLRWILWTIAKHPDIDLSGRHDPRGLLVNPDQQEDYALVRSAWLHQVSRNPGNAQVLANAARCLRLTERESAANWLKQAMRLDARGFFASDLGDVYADALCGISGMNPWEGPTSVNVPETQSSFARQAKEEAGRDAELAVRTGWALHLCSEALSAAKLTSTDYDPLAEQLLIQAANLDYPNPSKVPLLGQFYRNQEKKASGRLEPKWRIVDVSPDEEAKRLVEKPKRVSFTDKNFHSTVTLPVKIVIGIDGHVWKSEALDRSQLAAGVAAGSAQNWIFEPLRINGEPVQVSTVVQVTIEPL